MEENNNALTEQQADANPPENAQKKSSHHHSSGSSSHHHSSGKSSHHHSSGKSSHHHSSGKSSHHHHHSSDSSHHHHHHSSSSSSKSSKKHSKKKKKTNTDHNGLKVMFSFLLFVSITATAVFAGMKITVVNESCISNIFTNNEYVSSLYNDVLDYSRDMCMKYGIPDDCVEETITYKNINNIQVAYVSGVIDKDEKYSETTYSDMINSLSKKIEKATNEEINNQNIEVSEKQTETGVSAFSQEIASYIKEKVEFEYVSDLQSLLNVSAPVINVGIVLFAVFALAFFLLAISVEGKSYRSMRPIAISFLSAALMNLLLVVLVGIVSLFKDLLIYPSYLCASIERYINSCAGTFLFESFLLFFVGLVICTLVWRLKRNNE